MKWYDGGIADAVEYSKSKGAIFVVYIEGTDEKSQKITDLINNGELGQKLKQDNFVAIKVQAGSTAHQQFSEIYKEPSVPSIYFIGKNGVPLEIITGSSNLNEVSSKVDDVLSRAGTKVPSIPSKSATVLTDNFIKHEQSYDDQRTALDNNASKAEVDTHAGGESSKIEITTESPKEVKEVKVDTKEVREDTKEVKEDVKDTEQNSKEVKEDSKYVNEDNKDVEQMKTEHIATKDDKEDYKKIEDDTQMKEDSVKTMSAEEKIQLAKELIELKRQQKEKEEMENERLQEIERRKMGQNVQELKKWQLDQELKQLKEDRDREKLETKLARDRVLAQIAQDRAERQSKSQEAPLQPAESTKSPPPHPKPSSNISRLQFKLPDGSSVTNEFGVLDTLERVVSYLKTDLHITGSFVLATTFPKREFRSNDYLSTLSDLELVPNAVILVLPTSSGAISTNPQSGFVSSVIWGVLTPIFSLLGYLRNLIFGSNSANTKKTTNSPPNEPTRTNPDAATKRSVIDSSTVIRRQGNVHRLTDRNDSDDDNSTYNGNSTQQM